MNITHSKTTLKNLEEMSYQIYYKENLQKYPFLEYVIEFFLSKTHRMKEKSGTVSESWLNTSWFYKSHLQNMVLKS